MTDNPAQLYLIYMRGPRPELDPSAFHDMHRLDEGVYLLRTQEHRSRVYHAIKRLSQPESLLVVALAGEPKFKGMEAGALKWLRSLDQAIR
jgi:hypothetical protein